MKLNFASLLENTNLRAGLRVVREGESSQTDEGAFSAYRRRYHPKQIVYFDGDLRLGHPRLYERTPTGLLSSAFGAYQFTWDTLSDILPRYENLKNDASPYSQDCWAIALIHHIGALDLLINGDLYGALRLMGKRWASLPDAVLKDGHNYNIEWTRAEAVWKKYGGGVPTVVATSPVLAPIEDKNRQASPETIEHVLKQERNAMDPVSIFAMFGPMIGQLIPQLGKLFMNPEDKKMQRNMDAIQLIMDVFTKAGTNNPNASGANVAQVAQAIEAVKTDATLKEQVTRAVLTEPAIMAILEVGGGIAKAREHDLQVMTAEKPFYKTSAVFWVSVLLLPMVYWYVGGSIVGGIEIPADWPWYAQIPLKIFGAAWDAGAKVGLANLVVGLVLGGVAGVYFGVSYQQSKQQQPNVSV